MKKILVVILCIFMTAASATAPSAADGHEHSGVLEALRTEEGLDVPCCGVFRCSECGETYEASVTPADVGMPIVRLEGSMEGISKSQKVTLDFSYDDGNGVAFTSSATLKWQGSSSLAYPKKNYNVQFVKEDGSKNKVKFVSSWGKQSKYTLKANWVDHSGARNVVSAKLWGEIVHSRQKDDRLDPLVNGGAIDGFPVLLYHDGNFRGLYTLNTPKDSWSFGRKDETAREGLLFGDDWTDSVKMFEPIEDVNDPEASGWEVKYCSTEDDPDVGIGWLGEGMNDLIVFLRNNDGEALRAGLGYYTDVDRCIDYLLYVFFTCAGDNVGKNIIWATFDGVKYYPSAYDLDGTWGMTFDGEFPDVIPGWDSFVRLENNLLFVRLLDNYRDEITARYAELRESVLSIENIERRFSEFFGRIPAYVYAAEAEKWQDKPGMDINGLPQIKAFAEARAEFIDALFGSGTFRNPFSDVTSGTWFTGAVFGCYGKGYMTGTSDTTFDPDLPLSRAMFVTILAKLDGADTSSVTGAHFTDVPKGAWYSKAAEWAYRSGYTSGVGGGLFDPGAPVTRESLAQFLYNYSAKKGYDVTVSDDLAGYTDAGDVSEWAISAVRWAVGNGLISGTTDATLAPKLAASRAQAALVIMKFAENVR